jgi:hypothetical protein
MEISYFPQGSSDPFGLSGGLRGSRIPPTAAGRLQCLSLPGIPFNFSEIRGISDIMLPFKSIHDLGCADSGATGNHAQNKHMPIQGVGLVSLARLRLFTFGWWGLLLCIAIHDALLIFIKYIRKASFCVA